VLVVVLLLMGRLGLTFALLFFLFAVLYDVVLTVAALVLDDLLFKRFARARDLAMMIAAAFFQYLGFRQLLAFQRTLSFVNVFLFERRWGAIARTRIPNPASGRERA
jgi:hypothetical protein